MFQSQGCRLLLAYLIAMSAIFGTSATAVYIFFTRSLNQQLNEHLQTLGQTAIPSLTTVKNSEFGSFDQNLPWRGLLKQDQGLEWFDTNGKLLAKEGTTFPHVPLVKTFLVSQLNENAKVYQQQSQVRSLSIAVYAKDLDQKTLRLEGYVRASQSTEQLEWKLKQLLLGLEIGGVTALILSTISGIGLVWLALEPLKQSLLHSKQFSADAAHELRSPLTAISTAVEIMQTYPQQLSSQEAKKLNIIASATDQILRLVEDLRFLTQTDVVMEGSSIEHSPICLNELLEDLKERFVQQAQTRELHFKAHLLAEPYVKGDVYQLVRLFSNLLENAFKYTAAGGRVALFLEQSKRFAVVRVEDTGVGIPQEYLPLIFNRFWRSDKARSQHKDGLGLGLAIAQTIVQRHKGEIKVTSQVGVGTSFQVYLPLYRRR
jgi:two-component system, OmpR family, manganese sensing sensor histidine kinase